LYDPERGRCDLLERERQGAITILDVPHLGRPVCSQDVGVEPPHDGIDLGADRLEVVRPAGEDAARTDHPTHFCVESVMVEPVQGESDSHEIDRGILEWRLLCGSDEVADLRVGSCLGDLLGLASVATTARKCGVRPRAACPLPVAQSQARSWEGASEAR
jgi:hypothetical protein